MNAACVMNRFSASNRIKPSVLFFDAQSREISELAQHSLVEAIALQGHVDPLQAISEQIRECAVDMLHIVAHGRHNELTIGDTIIDSEYLLSNACELERWKVREIMLWSCNIGSDSSLVQTLTLLTGAKVHASDEPLGSNGRGSNWALGNGFLPFAWNAAVAWPHQLGSFT